jgi:hypothetical protein
LSEFAACLRWVSKKIPFGKKKFWKEAGIAMGKPLLFHCGGLHIPELKIFYRLASQKIPIGFTVENAEQFIRVIESKGMKVSIHENG